MKPSLLRILVFTSLPALLLVFSSLFFSPPLAAQAPLEPAQMPARTSAYLIWRGAPAGELRKTNNLFALWDDPDFATIRDAAFKSMTSDTSNPALSGLAAKDSSKPAMTPAEAQEFSTLLENSFVIGYLGKPAAKPNASAAPPKAADHPYNGMFFIYNRVGKEALLSKAILRARSQEKELPQISQVTVAGVPALKIESKTQTTWWVEHGKYAASADDHTVIEEIVARLEGASAETSSLAQSAAYKEAAPQLGGGILEFFIAVPNLAGLAPDSASGFKLAPVLAAIKLDAIHSICGRIALDNAKTRFQGSVLGETSSGSLLDFWPAGTASPASLSLLPPTAVSYSETQFDLPAFYEILKRGVAAAMPPGQQNTSSMVESLAQQRLGMPLADALALPSGDFASMQLSPALDPQKAVYVFGIRKKPETLKLLRSIFGDQITSERNEGDTTLLKISLHGGQGAKGVAQWGFYHLAITPDFIVGAQRSETVHELLAARPYSPAAQSPQFLAARAKYPERLDGLSYFDFQKVDWPALKARSIDDAKKLSEAKTTTAQQKAAMAKIPSILNDANPLVFPRHLHFAAGAAWKDAKGVHFDQWLE
jgi:hypothetical protein